MIEIFMISLYGSVVVYLSGLKVKLAEEKIELVADNVTMSSFGKAAE
jgi:hypothetical protein